MQRIRSALAGFLVALITLAGLGFGILTLGFAIVLGAALVLTVRLAGPAVAAEPQRRADAAAA